MEVESDKRPSLSSVCILRFLLLQWNSMTKATCGGYTIQFICLILPSIAIYRRKSEQKPQQHQPGGRSWCRGRGEALLTGLLSPCGLFSLLSYKTQDPQPTDGLSRGPRTHNGQGLPPSIKLSSTVCIYVCMMTHTGPGEWSDNDM